MKTFDVNIAIVVFATVKVSGRNAEDAERKAERTEFEFTDLKLTEGISKPDMVFHGESKEVHL